MARRLKLIRDHVAGAVRVDPVGVVGIAAASLTNFAGYVAWCLWLVGMAVVLWRARTTAPAPAKDAVRTAA